MHEWWGKAAEGHRNRPAEAKTKRKKVIKQTVVWMILRLFYFSSATCCVCSRYDSCWRYEYVESKVLKWCGGFFLSRQMNCNTWRGQQPNTERVKYYNMRVRKVHGAKHLFSFHSLFSHANYISHHNREQWLFNINYFIGFVYTFITA